MDRRKFLKTASLGASSVYMGCLSQDQYSELKSHKIDKIEFVNYNYNFVRHVGKNGKLGNHGQFKRKTAIKLITDQGALGWAECSDKAKKYISRIQGKNVTDLISPQMGIRPDVSIHFDLALHDLIGVILNQPVYRLLGAKGPKESKIYSGMIYFDELFPDNKPAGIDKIIDNCQWDIDYGYRQLKVKIGRSGTWYPKEQGIKKDIEVVKLIHKNFPNVEILVDANDQYTLSDTIQFLKGVEGIPLFWVEEPFIENYQDGKKLRQWMDQNGFEKTLYADGEYRPKHNLCMQMGKEKIMNLYLPDIMGFGFTRWRKLQPELIKNQMLASPHTWGSMLRTHYTSHLAAGLGNVATIEGVTSESNDIDYGDYKIINGKISPSEKPGFGMQLLV
ncbi:MAG: hypothetical protein MK132_25085 [Lentisphaerales bacterium]|nr:hypothetical protein [Lentisphaerales bacterium]